MKYDIFISYRRQGGYETAKHLFDLLSRDHYNVSFDIDTLRSGDFDTELLKRIDQCTDFIIILNIGAFDKCFDKKIDPKCDWLRCELAYALKKNKNIIPILLNGFGEFPSNLPEDIADVRFKNGPKYDQYYFDALYKKLISHFLESKPHNFSIDYTSILRIKPNMDCRVLRYGEELCIAKANEYNKIPLCKGQHMFEFISTEDSRTRLEKTYEMKDNNMEDCLTISLTKFNFTIGYTGDLLNGKYNGKGTYCYDGGDVYQGDFVDGIRHGKGVYYWTDGSRYEGEFRDDNFNGKGVQHWANGCRYEGEFKDDKRSGRGIQYWATGGRYEGEFKDDKLNGKGIYYWADGGRYEGEFKDDKFNGKGVRYYTNGSRYEGEFKGGELNGKGIYYWADGDRYEGEFVDSKMTKGIIYRKNGTKEPYP